MKIQGILKRRAVYLVLEQKESSDGPSIATSLLGQVKVRTSLSGMVHIYYVTTHSPPTYPTIIKPNQTKLKSTSLPSLPLLPT